MMGTVHRVTPPQLSHPPPNPDGKQARPTWKPRMDLTVRANKSNPRLALGTLPREPVKNLKRALGDRVILQAHATLLRAGPCTPLRWKRGSCHCLSEETAILH